MVYGCCGMCANFSHVNTLQDVYHIPDPQDNPTDFLFPVLGRWCISSCLPRHLNLQGHFITQCLGQAKEVVSQSKEAKKDMHPPWSSPSPSIISYIIIIKLPSSFSLQVERLLYVCMVTSSYPSLNHPTSTTSHSRTTRFFFYKNYFNPISTISTLRIFEKCEKLGRDEGSGFSHFDLYLVAQLPWKNWVSCMRRIFLQHFCRRLSEKIGDYL